MLKQARTTVKGRLAR